MYIKKKSSNLPSESTLLIAGLFGDKYLTS